MKYDSQYKYQSKSKSTVKTTNRNKMQCATIDSEGAAKRKGKLKKFSYFAEPVAEKQ